MQNMLALGREDIVRIWNYVTSLDLLRPNHSLFPIVLQHLITGKFVIAYCKSHGVRTKKTRLRIIYEK